MNSQDFPLLSHFKRETANRFTYFDNASTTQKPKQVIDTISHFYSYQNANTHRASYPLSLVATEQFEHARVNCANYINARADETFFCRGTTEGLNFLAQSLGASYLRPDDEIIISALEHHANLLPWQQAARQYGAKIHVIPLDDELNLDFAAFQALLNEKTRIVTITHASNALGNITPLNRFMSTIRNRGIISVIDGAQAISHLPVDVKALDCDFYVFSGHKVFGPQGIGVVYGKSDILHQLPPWQLGGEMISEANYDSYTPAKAPFRFEAGTQNISAALGLSAALDYLKQQDKDAITAHEQLLHDYFKQQLSAFKSVHLVQGSGPSLPIFSLVFDGIHSHDVGEFLFQKDICLRVGQHCVMPLMKRLKVAATLRASLCFYNTTTEIDYFFRCIDQCLQPDIFSLNPVKQIDSPLCRPQPGHDRLTQHKQALLQMSSKEDKLRYLVQLAKQYPRFPDHQRQLDNRIKQCESNVWLLFEKDAKGHHFRVDSDAKFLKGLLTIITEYCNGLSYDDILAIDIQDLVQGIHLERFLSASRHNGIASVMDAIKHIAQAQKQA